MLCNFLQTRSAQALSAASAASASSLAAALAAADQQHADAVMRLNEEAQQRMDEATAQHRTKMEVCVELRRV